MHGPARCLPALAAAALFALLAGPGCTRKHFRERADKDVEGVITQKNVFPDWQVKNWHAYPDPRARFADQTNPDRPPYPPDDYAARVMSPNPQKPTHRSGVGRVDGTGYVDLLETWDAQNRAEEPPPPARGTAPATAAAADDAAPTPVVPAGPAYRLSPAAATAAGADKGRPGLGAASAAPGGRGGPVAHAPAPQSVARPLPAKPQTAALPYPPRVLVGDSPAVRHAVPPHLPGALRPGLGGDAVAATEPNAAAPVNTPSAAEFGPWVAARPSMPGPVVTTDARGKPSITELRPPIVMVAVGETELNGKTVPAMAVVPVPGTWSAQPPDQAPDKAPDAQPGPKPPPPDGTKIDPKAGNPVGQAPAPGSGAPSGFVAAGDAAAEYLRALESDQVGYKLKIEQAVELGVLNGREFQDRREDLYLAALDVTLNRFTFAAQAFITEEAVRRSTGRALTNFRNGSETETFNTNVGLSKRFATGALLTTRLANQVLVDLSGDRPTTSISNLTLSLAQPFLRGGGKAVTLEPLTQSERTLVYAMRSYARFRKVFFVAIAAGGGYTNNPYGLQGLSPNLGRGIGGNLTAPNVGYLPLLLQSAIISNQRKNVAALEELLNTYRAYREGGQLAPLQVDQVEVQLLNSRGQLLGSATGGQSGIRGFLDALDNFKLQLGLPVTVPLELNDAPLRPIRLQLGRLESVSADARALETAAERFDRNTPAAQFRAGWRALLTGSPLMRGTNFAKAIGPRWDEWAKLNPEEFNARMKAVREERQKLLDARADRLLKRVPETPAEARRIDAVSADIDLGEFERAMREYEAQPWLKAGAAFVPQGVAFNRVFTAFQLLAIEARNERQEQARAQWPSLPPLPVEGANVLETTLDEAYTLGVRAALSSRLDLMNSRAQVVDAWRQIAVTANSLQGVFNVRYDLNSSTAPGGNNPVGFAAARSQHQLTFNAELPLVRRAERNNYRASLIAYQRQRRLLMAFEDNIANDVRGDLRELRTLGQLYRIQQRVVELGYSQVDNARFTQFAPLSFGANSDAGSAAALTQQVLQAQANLVQAQNGLYQIWVAYQTARMSLYLDLEQMPLDDRGVWCDEFFNRAERPEQQPAAADRQPAERLPAPRPLDGPGGEPKGPAVGGRRE